MATSRHERNARYKGDRGASGIDGMPDYPGNSGRQKAKLAKENYQDLVREVRSFRPSWRYQYSEISGMAWPYSFIYLPSSFNFFFSPMTFIAATTTTMFLPFGFCFAYFRRRMVPLKTWYPQSIEMVVRVVYAFPHSFRVV